MRTGTAWTTWTLAPDRIVVELDERLLAGVGIELELHIDDASGRTVGFWTWSQTGEVIAVVVGGEA